MEALQQSEIPVTAVRRGAEWLGPLAQPIHKSTQHLSKHLQASLIALSDEGERLCAWGRGMQGPQNRVVALLEMLGEANSGEPERDLSSLYMGRDLSKCGSVKILHVFQLL